MRANGFPVFLCSMMLFVPAGVAGQAGAAATPNWAAYHSTDDAYTLLRQWAEAFPSLTELYSIGETLEGTPLLVLEITNKATGPAADKPGYYYDGNIHAGELTGGEVALHFAWHVLSRYGTDRRIRNLLDTRVLYVRPKFNPDGADIALTTYHGLRSTPRPYDQDRDGLLDEDAANDLDGDGAITTMRVPNPSGVWKKSAEDARIMVRREDGDFAGEFYDLYSEGTDDDGDGAFNEDGIGGIDMNRNFPRNWGLEAEQNGAGPYPLSEPETRATIEFLHAHRNVTGIFHGHTSGGFLFRLPSTTAWDNFGREDQALILELAGKYAETTGQPVRASYTDPRVHRHGTLISWGYWDFGVVGFVPEFWGGFGRDYDGDGRVSETEQVRWNAEELGGAGFADWTTYEHPQLGTLEVGGWRSKFTRQNPPPQMLRAEIEQYVPWMLWLAEIGPRVEIVSAVAEPIGGGLVSLQVEVANTGYLPTNITRRAVDLQIVPPVRAMLDVRGGDLVSGRARVDLGHIAGSRDTQGRQGRAASTRTLEYVVRLSGTGGTAVVTVRSEKGGTVRREVALR